MWLRLAGISVLGATFCRWKTAYLLKGESGLIDSRPCLENPTLRVPKEFEEKIIYLRTTYHFGPLKISWYLKKILDIDVSRTGCYGVLKRNGLSRLPENCRKRSVPSFIRYEKKVPGHHVQVDVKFYSLSMNQVSVLSAFNIQPLMIQLEYAHLKSTKSIRRLMPWILSITL